MAGTPTKKSRAWIWFVVAAALMVGVLFLVHLSHPDVAVHSAVVDHEDLVSTISTNGKVEPIEDFQAHASGPSTVKQLFVAVGDHVSKGQQLVRLDASGAASEVAKAQAAQVAGDMTLRNMQRGGTAAELAANRSDLAAAVLQANSANASLSTLEALQARGSASAAEVAQAREKVTEANAHVAALRAQAASRYTGSDLATQRAFNAANASALNAAESAFSSVDLRSPIAGTVYSVTVKNSEYVPGPQESMVEVADLSRLQIRAYFDEPEIGKLAKGQAVKIVWDAKPDQVWHGHVTQPPTTVTTYNETRNVGECIISVDDSDGQLLPNTNVTVTVTTAHHSNVLTLPRAALHTRGMQDYVFRIIDGKLVKTAIKVGAIDETRMEVVSGLKLGDEVALRAVGQSELADGLKVKAER
jgi:HlyD family secretion protein